MDCCATADFRLLRLRALAALPIKSARAIAVKIAAEAFVSYNRACGETDPLMIDPETGLIDILEHQYGDALTELRNDAFSIPASRGSSPFWRRWRIAPARVKDSTRRRIDGRDHAPT